MTNRLEIIPVIDVMGGKVVHARGGVRADYPLLTSVLTTSTQPLHVIADLLAWYDFSTIYLADLDAICDQKRDFDLYRAIVEQFPQLTVYLDAGVQTQQDWQQIASLSTVYPVIGSETVIESSWLKDEAVRQKSILSLDFKHDQFLGNKQILANPDDWSEKVIAMNLEHIASQQGPDLDLLTTLKMKAPQSQIIAAGGVRIEQDLITLAKQGIKQVLVASALHNGGLDKACVAKFSAG